MNKKSVLINILAVAVLIAVLGIAEYIHSNEVPNATPPNPGPTYVFSYKINSEPSNQDNTYFNATQGATLPINLTFTSLTNQPIEIPIENLTLSTYSSTINPKVWADTGNASFVQDNVFTYSFSLNPIVVQPAMPNSTTLKIKFALNAPVGQYYLDLRLGRVMMINTQSQANYYSTLGVEVILLPNQ